MQVLQCLWNRKSDSLPAVPEVFFGNFFLEVEAKDDEAGAYIFN